MTTEDANFGQVEAQNSVHAVLHFQDLDYLPIERLARVEAPWVCPGKWCKNRAVVIAVLALQGQHGGRDRWVIEVLR